MLRINTVRRKKEMAPISQRAKILLTGFACALPAFLVFRYGSTWLYERTVVSYEVGFNTYLMREQIALHVFAAIVAFIAALIYHPTWRVGVASAITGSLMFRMIDIWIYSLVSKAWFEYRGLITPLLTAILIGGVFGFLAVSRQYYHTKSLTIRPTE
jgi:hypothetical protein